MRAAHNLVESFWLTKLRTVIAFDSKRRDSKLDHWKLALSQAVTRVLGKDSIESMLNKGENCSLIFLGEVIKTVCMIFAA